MRQHRLGYFTQWLCLLIGKALDVYPRLSDVAAVDYDQLKEALLKRYNLTEDRCRTKFRSIKPEMGESAEQLLVRLRNYSSKCSELLKTDHTFTTYMTCL